MIGLPYNDYACLGPVSEILVTMVDEQDPALAELADQYPTQSKLIDYFRSQPQRDDLGDPDDGPRVHQCSPPQRLDFHNKEPNCFERAAGFVGVMELNQPDNTYQLATVDTAARLTVQQKVELQTTFTRGC